LVNILQFSFSLSYTGPKILLHTFLSKMFNCFLSLFVSVQVSYAYVNVLSIIVFFSLNFISFDMVECRAKKLLNRGYTNFRKKPPQNSRRLKETRSKFHTDDQQILGATLQNLQSWATKRPRLVYPPS